ncbi:MAG: HipA domain-containing protein [Akkermansiaceae bacterium]|nr:HipA domain-containing protein [Akkermansiaceae bacterium]
MQRHFEALGIPWNRVTALRKLTCQGERKMGALAFRPSTDEPDFNAGLVAEIGEMVEAARRLLAGEPGEVLTALPRGGMSPGGAQPKASVAISKDFSELRLDDPPPAGFHHWLIKFDTEPSLQTGRIEAAYADMARAAGITVPETRLLEAAGACHFLTRRFDRSAAGHRLHLHSYSGLTHTPLRDGLEYGDLLEITRTLTRDHRSVEEIFRRAVFNVLTANDDDHGRNHAFLMDADGSWTLAPAFDLTLASYPLASGFRAARINGRASGITRPDLLQLAAAHDLQQAKPIIEQVVHSISQWPAHAAANGISPAQSTWVTSQLQLDF